MGRSTTKAVVRGRQLDLAERIRTGEEDLSDWDIEELSAGKRRDKNGNLGGRKPKFIPSEVYDELARRVQTDVLAELRKIVHEHAGPMIIKVLNGELAPEEVPGYNLQMKTLQDLMDRVGLARKQDVEITGTMQHEHVIQDVTISRDLDVVDAEVIHEEEEFEDDDFVFDD